MEIYTEKTAIIYSKIIKIFISIIIIFKIVSTYILRNGQSILYFKIFYCYTSLTTEKRLFSKVDFTAILMEKL